MYLFSIDEQDCFLAECKETPVGYRYIHPRDFLHQDVKNHVNIYAAFTAFHLQKWYRDNRYCGKCGNKTEHDHRERAMRCPKCGNIIYPRINPAVIIGITEKDRILLTRYAHGYTNNALVAGFTEIGETLEETVKREAYEETGLKVKNIRYYKSQPWGIAQDILRGLQQNEVIHSSSPFSFAL